MKEYEMTEDVAQNRSVWHMKTKASPLLHGRGLLSERYVCNTVCACVWVCVRVCVCACMCVCVHACVYGCVYVTHHTNGAPQHECVKNFLWDS